MFRTLLFHRLLERCKSIVCVAWSGTTREKCGRHVLTSRIFTVVASVTKCAKKKTNKFKWFKLTFALCVLPVVTFIFTSRRWLNYHLFCVHNIFDFDSDKCLSNKMNLILLCNYQAATAAQLQIISAFNTNVWL